MAKEIFFQVWNGDYMEPINKTTTRWVVSELQDRIGVQGMENGSIAIQKKVSRNKAYYMRGVWETLWRVRQLYMNLKHEGCEKILIDALEHEQLEDRVIDYHTITQLLHPKTYERMLKQEEEKEKEY